MLYWFHMNKHMRGHEQSNCRLRYIWIGLKATIPSVHMTGMAQSLQGVVGPPTFLKDFYNSMRFLSSVKRVAMFNKIALR